MHISNPSDAHAEIATRVAALGEWITGFEIDGQRYGGTYFPKNDDRLRLFVEALRQREVAPRRILECGCLEGGHTIALSKAFPDAQIIAVDVRSENLVKARLLCELMGCSNVTFVQDDLDEPKEMFKENYDAIFCVGLLYHLSRPDRFLQRAGATARDLWLWTVYCAEDDVEQLREQSRGRVYLEPVEHPLSGTRAESYFPTLGSLVEFIWAAGFGDVRLVRKEMTANNNGPAIMLHASR